MVFRCKVGAVAVGFICFAGTAMPEHASAITADLAKTCRALTAKQFPPREPANPAAGSAKGSGRDQTAYFNKCVANNGKMDDGGK
ncbi:hypothetical protein ACU4GH_19990 [Bradyrhizobium betae]|uniref:hypothetical protein n=1 Tax=Bradyrhizobium betae TaxID=244734 RepID=UPI003D673F57